MLVIDVEGHEVVVILDHSCISNDKPVLKGRSKCPITLTELADVLYSAQEKIVDMIYRNFVLFPFPLQLGDPQINQHFFIEVVGLYE